MDTEGSRSGGTRGCSTLSRAGIAHLRVSEGVASNALDNNKMQRTKHGLDRASPLILVLCGPSSMGPG